MTDYNAKLEKLAQQCARKKKVTALREELYTQQRELKERVYQLKSIMRSEQTDVDRLEGRSLFAFFYNVIGKMDEKLTKEKQEAYAAKVKYDAAMAELTAVESDIEKYTSELLELRNCENEYEAVLAEKAAAIKSAGVSDADALLKLENRIHTLKAHMREINEAVSAGHRAKTSADSVLDSLSRAESWSTYDMIGGGGILSHMAKHEHLDTAQVEVECLQVALRRFKTELADVRIDANMQVNIDGFLRFADYFFDGLIVDWEVRKRIQNSAEQVRDVRYKIESVLRKLSMMYGEAEAEAYSLEKEYNELIIKAEI